MMEVCQKTILNQFFAPYSYSYHPIQQGFSSFLLEPYIKAVTHSCEVEWWRTLIFECVTFFAYLILHQISHCKWGFKLIDLLAFYFQGYTSPFYCSF